MLGISQQEIEAHQDAENAFAAELEALYRRVDAAGLSVDSVQYKGLRRYYESLHVHDEETA